MGCCCSRDEIIIDFTPLHDACNHRDVQKVSQILDDERKREQTLQLHQQQTNNLLLLHKLVNARTPQSNMTSLQISCSARDVSKDTTEICRLLVDASASISDVDTEQNKNSAFLLAVRFGNVPVVRDVFIPFLNGTMLTSNNTTAKDDSESMAKIINSKNSNGETPLVLACRLTNSKTALELVTLLLNNGASIQETTFNEGKSNVLTVALLNEHEDVFLLMVNKLAEERKIDRTSLLSLLLLNDGDNNETDVLLPKPTMAGIESWRQFVEKRGMNKVVCLFDSSSENSKLKEPIQE